MRNRNWLAFLIAPLAFLALLLVLGEYSVSAGPHRYADERNDYTRSVAVVWALDSIKDDVSCHDALNQYQRDFRGLERDAERDIADTYDDLVGDCDDHDPPRQARERAAAFLQGMKVTR